MSSMLVILLILVGVVIALVSVYNGLVQKRIACDTMWAQITVQLKRRLDLIPNLIETVKGYASHEKETLERVIAARNSAISATNVNDQVKAQTELSAGLRQIFALAESYPDLKANQNFLQLQTELANTENMISGSREQYNNSVSVYNIAIAQVPAVFIAGAFGFTARAFFELSAEEKAIAEKAPKVSF